MISVETFSLGNSLLEAFEIAANETKEVGRHSIIGPRAEESCLEDTDGNLPGTIPKMVINQDFEVPRQLSDWKLTSCSFSSTVRTFTYE